VTASKDETAATPNASQLSPAAFPAAAFKAASESVLNGNRAVLLVMHEARQLKPTPSEDANNILFDLRQGVGLPIVPILPRCANAPDHLRPSVSDRFAEGNNVPMEPLAAAESLRCIKAVLN